MLSKLYHCKSNFEIFFPGTVSVFHFSKRTKLNRLAKQKHLIKERGKFRNFRFRPPPPFLNPYADAWTEQSTKTWNISGILGARHAASRKAHSLKDTYFSWPIELPLHFCEHIWVHTMNHFLVCLAIYFEANNV